MQKLQRRDVKDLVEYEKARAAFQRHIIELKKNRRVSVGPLMTFVFENRETVLFQIQEILRAERIVQEARIDEEIAVNNTLIPEPFELSATLLIEITDKQRVKPILDRFLGIDRGQTAWIQFGDEQVYAQFEPGHSKEDKISAVHFVRFTFTPPQARHFCTLEDEAYLSVNHGPYKHQAQISPGVRQSLVQDLLEG